MTHQIQDKNGIKTELPCVLGVRINPLNALSLNEEIHGIVEANKKALILHVNIHCMNLAYDNEWLREFLNRAYLVFCDGAGVMLGARLLGFKIPERITYADWMWQLSEYAALKSMSFFFLGGRPGVAEKAAARLRERFPGLRIAGAHHGYFDKTKNGEENKFVVKTINMVKPGILLVGFGMPLQEKWLMANWDQIDANVALTGGAVFDYVSGELKRGPKWMTGHGLEWLARMIIEPRRLWRRYLLGNPLFFFRVLRQRFNLV